MRYLVGMVAVLFEADLFLGSGDLMMGDVILVTGGAGFIGSGLCDALLLDLQTAQIVVVDNLSTGKRSNLSSDPRLVFYEGDVCDSGLMDLVFDSHSFTYIYHLAAVASVQDSIIDPVRTHQVNFDSTLYLIEKARHCSGLKRFLFASSAAVYGNQPQLPARESDAVHPVSPYGVDKYASERYVVNAAALFGIPTTAFRFFNVYGPRQNPSSPYSGVISIFMAQFCQDNPRFTIFGDGTQTRDFIYVDDLIDAILYLSRFTGAVGQVFNLGTGQERSLLQLASIVSDLFEREVLINYADKRDGDIERSYADISALRQAGFKKPIRTLDEGLRLFWETVV